MRQTVLKSLQKGQTIAALSAALDGALAVGKPLRVTIDPRSQPWVDHIIDGFVDGPPVSSVVAILSARDPGADHKWRRFTVTRKGPWHCELGAFPTPFNNGVDPLSPGIPPGASRRI
ncbi:MAG: hypothetical protein GXP62_07090 [Oligoflexia bacterium]|nr:hypothetical protein [Oligoflexia bacterium]